MVFVNLSNPFDIFDAISQVASVPDSLSFYKSIHKTMNNVYKQGFQTTQVTIPTNHLLSLWPLGEKTLKYQWYHAIQNNAVKVTPGT